VDKPHTVGALRKKMIGIYFFQSRLSSPAELSGIEISF